MEDSELYQNGRRLVNDRELGHHFQSHKTTPDHIRICSAAIHTSISSLSQSLLSILLKSSTIPIFHTFDK